MQTGLIDCCPRLGWCPFVAYIVCLCVWMLGALMPPSCMWWQWLAGPLDTPAPTPTLSSITLRETKTSLCVCEQAVLPDSTNSST